MARIEQMLPFESADQTPLGRDMEPLGLNAGAMPIRHPCFIRRVVIRNYKSIAACDVSLSNLTFLVGPNGSGKSNFLDALRFVTDALRTALDHAVRNRGGVKEILRRSSTNPPDHFGVRLEFALPTGQRGFYSFRIAALR